ncbi:uncharacterized protein MONBRDRAFT_38320 [Monosiga brevicollis MX1]|uniref:GPN-loop GTPase 2 n=1 Tax=Monosiga brevicollis TaxID=81824 RepID=A9V6Z7_MONBE|nr:uncharacterized protein MONBRDRAFT_38320 [Monosiga brevicollis MX1]EDQ86702.1 predicted protein [Monosiga brevicollis MX1]|eukprot:XP_001748538.1 hypothetical protein [Monosiga brevicollis MX1]
MAFAQLIIGPPGTGKTTYAQQLREFLGSLGRDVLLVNLDPSCDDERATANAFDVDIRDLISAREVMERLELGPNGGLMFCMEYLHEHLDWLEERVKAVDRPYILFDCPGQVELYTHHSAMRDFLHTLQHKWHFRVCTVNLIDSYMCSDAGNFIAALLASLSMMVQLETPHVNVLSKVDLVEAYGRLDFNLEFYTDVLDLRYLLDRLPTSPLFERHRAFNAALCDLVEDFSLVQFYTLCIDNKELLWNLTRAVDKALGYLYTSQEQGRIDMETASIVRINAPLRGAIVCTEISPHGPNTQDPLLLNPPDMKN